MSTVKNKRKMIYDKKRKRIQVSFNLETEKDLLCFAESIDFSDWVKRQIIKKMTIPPCLR